MTQVPVTLVTVVRVEASPAGTAFWVDVGEGRGFGHLPVRQPVNRPAKKHQKGLLTLVVDASVTVCVCMCVEQLRFCPRKQTNMLMRECNVSLSHGPLRAKRV